MHKLDTVQEENFAGFIFAIGRVFTFHGKRFLRIAIT